MWSRSDNVRAARMSIRHRNDIDGLRALAIVPIVLFHAGLSQLAGGFIGVDIFFVISGYLITSIVVRDLEGGTFSIVGFYQRRVVRILPALVVVLAIVLVAGCLLLLPNEIRELGASGAAASGFGANFYFWNTTDYFNEAAELKPLLHMWSLGVEEQFYLLYPPFLYVAYRAVSVRQDPLRRLRWLFALIVIGSFVFGLVLKSRLPDFVFYLLPSRAWELGLGGMVAIGALPRVSSARLRDAISVLGLAAIVAGLVVIDSSRDFPAPWALLPCLGTAALIGYGEGAITSVLLSAAPLRWIGLISYSLYLWHWPIISFYRIRVGLELTIAQATALIAASVIAATGSYVFVERIFLARYRRVDPSQRRRIVACGVAAVLLAVLAGLVVMARAYDWHDYPPEVVRVVSYADYKSSDEKQYQFRNDTCFITKRPELNVKACMTPSTTKPNIVVVGDSHAAQYWRAIALRFTEAEVLQATATGCRPTLFAAGSKRCTDIVDFVFRDLASDKNARIDVVVLAGRWRDDDLLKLPPTIQWLRSRGIEVTVIGPTVEYESSFPQLLARSMLASDLARMADERVVERRHYDRLLGPLVRAAGARYISIHELECPHEECRLLAPDGGPLHFDYGHLTLSGARYLVERFPPLFPDRPRVDR
jgi:peptidoglycan/LPS O-acetylase OafA/YrhL